jgi:hypothetical protein
MIIIIIAGIMETDLVMADTVLNLFKQAPILYLRNPQPVIIPPNKGLWVALGLVLDLYLQPQPRKLDPWEAL